MAHGAGVHRDRCGCGSSGCRGSVLLPRPAPPSSSASTKRANAGRCHHPAVPRSPRRPPAGRDPAKTSSFAPRSPHAIRDAGARTLSCDRATRRRRAWRRLVAKRPSDRPGSPRPPPRRPRPCEVPHRLRGPSRGRRAGVAFAETPSERFGHRCSSRAPLASRKRHARRTSVEARCRSSPYPLRPRPSRFALRDPGLPVGSAPPMMTSRRHRSTSSARRPERPTRLGGSPPPPCGSPPPPRLPAGRVSSFGSARVATFASDRVATFALGLGRGAPRLNAATRSSISGSADAFGTATSVS